MSEGDPSAAVGLGISVSRPFVMTAAFDDARAAILVEWVQQCAMEPPMVCVAVRKGRPIEPLIRDSHAFALCESAEDDLYLVRKLKNACEHEDDVLELMDYESLETGSPCITRAGRVLDCEVVRHIDFEADYELYIAQVLAVKTYEPAPRPASRGVRRAVSRSRASIASDAPTA